MWFPVEVRSALVSDFAKHPEIWNDWENRKQLRDTMSYVSFFAPAEGLRVRVVPRKAFREFVVRPACYGIKAERHGDAIDLVIADPSQRISLELDGDRAHNLFLLPEKPIAEQPPRGEGVIYYGRGVHEVGRIDLHSNQTLYLDEGAMVYGYVRAYDADHVTIAGRGTLCGAHEPHCDEQRTQLINIERCTNLTLRDVTLIDSPAWTVRIKRCHKVSIDNLKVICWILNSDGIDICNSSDVEIRNCFFRTYDDCITIKNQEQSVENCERVLVERCTAWTDCANGFLVGPECGTALDPQCSQIRQVVFRDCIVLETPALADSREGDDGWRSGCAAINARVWAYKNKGGGALSDVLFERIMIDDLDGGRPLAADLEGDGERTGSLSEVTFRDICFEGRNYLAGQIRGADQQHPIKGITFENVRFNGKRILHRASADVIFNEYVNSLKFK